VISLHYVIEQITRHPLPAVLVVIDLACVVWYAREPHYGRMVYWFAAALITGAATWGMR
jgi:hypothetical protein